MSEQTEIEQLETNVSEQAEQVEQEQQPAETQVEEQGNADELADLMAGYNKSETKQEPQQEQQQDEAPAQAMPSVAGIPEEELVAKLNKVDELEKALNERLQKVNNMLGNMKQRLEAIPKDAPRQEVRQLTKESLKKLNELGFEEIADALAEDLNGAFSAPGQQPVDVQGEFKKAMREISIQELTDLHPDWQVITDADENGTYQHPGFSQWFGTLDQAMQEKVRSSNSVAFASRALDSYKAWEQEKASKEAAARKTSESRLKNAMTPTQGKAAATPSRLPDDAGLWAGYNKGPKPFRR